jgi:endo-1,4-beta-xylanase
VKTPHCSVWLFFWFTLSVWIGFGSVSAQEVPSGGTSLVAQATINETSFYSNTNGDGPVATRSFVAVTGQVFTTVARIATERPTGEVFTSAMTFDSNRAVAQGDVVLLRFWARAIETQDESGTVKMQAYVEGPAPNYQKSANYQVNVASAWKEFFVPFEVAGAQSAGGLGIKFGFGATGRPQVLEFGGVEVYWYGTSRTLAEMPRTSFDYVGREPDAPWRTEAASRIEQYRKSDYAVVVQDDRGMPVAGVTIRVKQQRHDFEFGTAMVASRIMSDTATHVTYRTHIRELFNAGTLENDLKWPPWDGEWGNSFNQSQTVAALQWAQTNNIAMRGHVLVWPSVRNLPDALESLVLASDASVPQRVLDHIADVMQPTNGLLVDWDVMNEPYDNFDLMVRYGYDEMAEWFKAAQAQNAEVGRYINDYGILSGGGLNTDKQDAYADSVRRIQADGGPITGIGFQGHFSGTPTSIPKVWEVLQRYATDFPDLEFRVTEFDVSSSDEELQADFLRDFYTVAFSHPQMKGVQLWGFWEGAHWRAEAALYRLDWTEKLNGAAYRNLIYNQWWTNESKVTGSDGRVSGRGFNGTYVVETAGGQKLGEFDINATQSSPKVVVLSEQGPSSSKLANLSTRGSVLSGFGKMVAGFVIEGDASKDLVIRAVGPRLSAFGVPGVLENPQIAIYRANTLVPMATVDSWDSSLTEVFSTLGAFSLEDDKASAATRVDLEPGAYTVEVSGVDDGTGVAIVEVYDAATGSPAQMVNLSTRGAVGAGAEIMVAGFVIEGTDSQRVLVRGIGPALTGFQVDGALADPVLKLFRSTPTGAVFLQENRSWDDVGNASEIENTTAIVGGFALAAGSGDAALLVELEPGAYTVELAGVDDGTGIGLIEVYRVP